MALAFGIDIGGTKGAVCLLDMGTQQVVARTQFPAPPTSAAYIEALVAAMTELAAAPPAVGVAGSPVCIGIACGGPLDTRSGRVQAPPHLPDWLDVPICERLTARTGLPSLLMNDANAGALAEWYWGAGRGVDDMIYVTFGTGFGAGIIAAGRLIEGVGGMAGEIGHVQLTEDGPLGWGKRGSVEGWCSGGGLGARSRGLAVRHPRAAAALLAAANGDVNALDARTVYDTARTGDAAALALVHETGLAVGRALAVLVDILNPAIIVLGSQYVRAGDLLAGPIHAGLAEQAIARCVADVRVVPAALGEATGDLATLAIVRYHRPDLV